MCVCVCDARKHFNYATLWQQVEARTTKLMRLICCLAKMQTCTFMWQGKLVCVLFLHFFYFLYFFYFLLFFCFLYFLYFFFL